MKWYKKKPICIIIEKVALKNNVSIIIVETILINYFEIILNNLLDIEMFKIPFIGKLTLNNKNKKSEWLKNKRKEDNKKTIQKEIENLIL